MNNIEKSIFDSLASGSGINLPGLGSLYVEQRPAELISGKSLRPPHNKIIFSPEENPAYISAGTTPGYGEWLRGSAHGKDAWEINGVGVLRGGIFYPSVELHDILNPQGTRPVALKPHYGFWKKFLVGAGVIAAAAIVIGIAVIISDYAVEKNNLHNSTKTLNMAKAEAEGAAQRGESTIAPSVAGAIEEEATGRDAFSAPSAITNEASTQTSASSDNAAANDMEIEDEIQRQLESYASASAGTLPGFYLVAGVFSDPSNADRFIERDQLGIGSRNYEKVDSGKGRTIVSAFYSPDRETVEAKRRALAGVNDELWIYEKK